MLAKGGAVTEKGVRELEGPSNLTTEIAAHSAFL